MDISELGSIILTFMSIVMSCNNLLADLFIDWKLFIILIETGLIIDLKTSRFKTRENMIALRQIFDTKRIQALLSLINPDVLSQELEGVEEESFVSFMLHADFTLNNRAISLKIREGCTFCQDKNIISLSYLSKSSILQFLKILKIMIALSKSQFRYIRHTTKGPLRYIVLLLVFSSFPLLKKLTRVDIEDEDVFS
jgi:hypothetical protein